MQLDDDAYLGTLNCILVQARGKNTPNAETLQKREVFLLRINLILGVLVLLLTAIARSA